MRRNCFLKGQLVTILESLPSEKIWLLLTIETDNVHGRGKQDSLLDFFFFFIYILERQSNDVGGKEEREKNNLASIGSFPKWV